MGSLLSTDGGLGPETSLSCCTVVLGAWTTRGSPSHAPCCAECTCPETTKRALFCARRFMAGSTTALPETTTFPFGTKTVQSSTWPRLRNLTNRGKPCTAIFKSAVAGDSMRSRQCAATVCSARPKLRKPFSTAAVRTHSAPRSAKEHRFSARIWQKMFSSLPPQRCCTFLGLLSLSCCGSC